MVKKCFSFKHDVYYNDFHFYNLQTLRNILLRINIICDNFKIVFDNLDPFSVMLYKYVHLSVRNTESKYTYIMSVIWYYHEFSPKTLVPKV